MEIIDPKVKKSLLLGNEAVVRGALEAGLSFAASYPGTPASEIADTLAKIAKEVGFYFEYSSNEKVALEAAAGAAFSGLPSMVSMKHYGLNVALDSLLPLVYLECPLVVVVADDPGSWSSIQAEQDSRWISQMGQIPTLEPSDSQEAKEMTKLAFDLATKYKIPILIRLTTRVSHTRSMVEFGKMIPPQKQGQFIKNPQGFTVGSKPTIARHQKVLEKIEKIKKEVVRKTKLNFVTRGKEKLGIIASGVSYYYAKEAIKELNLNIPILKIGFSYPFPDKIIQDFIKNLKKVLVIEEIDPILENEIKKIAKEVNCQLKIHGKDLLPSAGEMKPEFVLSAITQTNTDGTRTNTDKFLYESVSSRPEFMVEKRLPTLCPGCPHRATFWAVRQALAQTNTDLTRTNTDSTRTNTDLTRTNTDSTRTNTDSTRTSTDSKGELLYQDLTYQIRGIAFNIKKQLGLGHKEAIYRKAFEKEFKKNNIKFEKEKVIDIKYDDEKIGTYRPDFIIDNKIILEIKAIPSIGKFETEQIWHYLKGSEYKLALLINFGRDDIAIERFIYTPGYLSNHSSPHKSVFSPYKSVVFGGDIGCYLLGALPPFNLADYIAAMGAGVGISHGVSKATGQKPVIFIGDSTFFHAGIPALINAVYNQSDILLIILDNRITAMTGHQPHPGVGLTGMGDKTKALKIEEIAKACGVDQVAVANVYNFSELVAKIKELYQAKGVSVLVAKGECRLLTVRKMARSGIQTPKFEIVKQSPDLEILKNFGCPAIRKDEKGKYYIEKNLCWGCSVCHQLFPENIKIKKNE